MQQTDFYETKNYAAWCVGRPFGLSAFIGTRKVPESDRGFNPGEAWPA